MSRSYTEARAAWQAWYTIYTRTDVETAKEPIGYTHQCGAVTELDVNNDWPDLIVCSGCRCEIKRPETECIPTYGPTPAARPSKIRVLRVLEYTYDNAMIAAHDMPRWTLGGSPRPGLTIRSTTFPFGTITWDT